MPERQGMERGIRMFTYLAEMANLGHAVGISYGGFIAYLHGATEFQQVAGRNFLPSDSMEVVSIAWKITEAAGGRKKVVRLGTAIDAGMDTFIWKKDPPFGRPAGAWNYSLPYTRQQWLSIFPDGVRRLMTPGELRRVAADNTELNLVPTTLDQQVTPGQGDFPYEAPKYLPPVLRILDDGKDHSVEEIRERILTEFPLTPEQLHLRRPGFPITVFVNKVAYALARLVFHKGIERIGPESYRITDHGRDLITRYSFDSRKRES
jgi:hypothetical protein